MTVRTRRLLGALVSAMLLLHLTVGRAGACLAMEPDDAAGSAASEHHHDAHSASESVPRSHDEGHGTDRGLPLDACPTTAACGLLLLASGVSDAALELDGSARVAALAERAPAAPAPSLEPPPPRRR